MERGRSRVRRRTGKRAREAVARLRERAAAAGERWSAREQVEAILLPLMGRRRPLPDLLVEVAEASTVLLPEERRDVLGSMVGLAYTYLESGLAEQLLEVLRTMNALEELVADYLIKGRTQGIAEGRQEDVLRVLGKRFGPVPEVLAGELAAVHDPDQLTVLLDAAVDAESLDGFVRVLRGRHPAPGGRSWRQARGAGPNNLPLLHRPVGDVARSIPGR